MTLGCKGEWSKIVQLEYNSGGNDFFILLMCDVIFCLSFGGIGKRVSVKHLWHLDTIWTSLENCHRMAVQWQLFPFVVETKISASRLLCPLGPEVLSEHMGVLFRPGMLSLYRLRFRLLEFKLQLFYLNCSRQQQQTYTLCVKCVLVPSLLWSWKKRTKF